MSANDAIVIVDQPGPYEAARTILADAGFQIIGTASSLTDGIELLRRHRPALAVVDLAIEGLASIHALHEAAPDCALLVLTRHPELAEAVVLAGALAAIDPRKTSLLDAAVRNVRVRLDQPAGQRI